MRRTKIGNEKLVTRVGNVEVKILNPEIWYHATPSLIHLLILISFSSCEEEVHFLILDIVYVKIIIIIIILT